MSAPGGAHRPPVYQLRLGDMVVYYTVEALAVIVRGYTSLRPLRPGEVRDDMSDGYHSDNHWDRLAVAPLNAGVSQ